MFVQAANFFEGNHKIFTILVTSNNRREVSENAYIISSIVIIVLYSCITDLQ